MTDRATLERLEEWHDVLDDSSYYEILGVLEICDDEALRDAFRGFALAFHPDLFRGAPEPVLAVVRRVFQRGTEAYRVLANRELRIRYDMGLQRGKRRLEEALAPKSEVPPPVSLRSKGLDELARSGGAKLAAQKAAKLIEKGDLESAKKELEKALAFDGNANPKLAEQIEAITLVLYAGGAG